MSRRRRAQQNHTGVAFAIAAIFALVIVGAVEDIFSFATDVAVLEYLAFSSRFDSCGNVGFSWTAVCTAADAGPGPCAAVPGTVFSAARPFGRKSGVKAQWGVAISGCLGLRDLELAQVRRLRGRKPTTRRVSASK